MPFLTQYAVRSTKFLCTCIHVIAFDTTVIAMIIIVFG